MDTIFINSANSKTSNPHRSLLSLLEKINLKRSDKYVALTNRSIGGGGGGGIVGNHIRTIN